MAMCRTIAEDILIRKPVLLILVHNSNSNWQARPNIEHISVTDSYVYIHLNLEFKMICYSVIVKSSKK